MKKDINELFESGEEDMPCDDDDIVLMVMAMILTFVLVVVLGFCLYLGDWLIHFIIDLVHNV